MKKRDIQIIIGLLFIAVVGFLAVKNVGKNHTKDGYVNIYVENILYKKVLLSHLENVIVDIDGKYNEIEINSNGALMLDSNCDNQDCLHQGEVTLNNINERIMGGWIICLPNKVSIELVGSETE